MENSLNFLSRKAGFNTALRHFKSVNSFVADMNEGYNLADLVNEALEEDAIERYQVRAILNALLVDKFGYAYLTHNLGRIVEDAGDIVSVIDKWGKVQIIVCYYHPQAGLYVINPANPEHWEGALPLVKGEYLAVFAGPARGKLDAKTLKSAANDFIKVLYGRAVKNDGAYKGVRTALKESSTPSFSETEAAVSVATSAPQATAPAQPAQVRGGSRKKITPRYSVVVTNELFHNGNVEAWKKIIASYRAKYSGLDVLVWYENERINDLNSLFKWGKVKHGVPIMFSAAGDEIRDVRKLQRYLYEGASPRFEAFLKGGLDQVLDLF
ncbi:MAG: hypothetical protein KOO61_09625 [Spirochaetales bacterium]|nr:hypothetical protein [Spirochaetales bacterium]